jgi:hypothetical protein
MSNLWVPDAASEAIEKAMEDKDVPEEDWDEVRRFAELLRIPKGPDGKRQVSKQMHDWATGVT